MRYSNNSQNVTPIEMLPELEDLEKLELKESENNNIDSNINVLKNILNYV